VKTNAASDRDLLITSAERSAEWTHGSQHWATAENESVPAAEFKKNAV